MSHSPLRKERNCLNCGTYVQGRYCHQCGQENVEPRESFWAVFTHFVADIFHFEGKFFKTVGLLIRRPGFLTAEYMRGRRMSYLHPVRMYLLTSAVFFLIYFTFFSGRGSSGEDHESLGPQDRIELASSYRNILKGDTARADLKEALALLADTSRQLNAADLQKLQGEVRKEAITFSTGKYNTLHEYDSIQAGLSSAKRDGWLSRIFIRKILSLKDKYNGNMQELVDKLQDEVAHRIPYMLFISLPLFMLILKLVYIRRRQFTLVDHAVFTLHFYIFCFVLLFVIQLIDSLARAVGWVFLDVITSILYVYALVYLMLAMYNFYGQSIGKTIGKFFIIFILAALMALLLLAIFFSYSTLTIK